MPLSPLWWREWTPRPPHGFRGNAIALWARNLSEEEEKSHEDLGRDAKVKDLDAWRQFKESEPLKGRDISKAVVSTRWVLTWKVVGCKELVMARLLAKGFRDPYLKDGSVDAPGCTSLRPSHPRIISPGTIEKWKFRSLDIRNAWLRAGGLSRKVLLRAPTEWGSSNFQRIR